MRCGLGQCTLAGKRESLVVAAAVVSVRVSHGTAGGCDRPVPAGKQRACLNVGVPEIQCSVRVLCAAALPGASFQSRNDAPCSRCHGRAHFSLLLSKPPLGNIPQFWPHSAGDGVWVSAVGAGAVPDRAGVTGCRQLLGWVIFLAEGPGSLQLRLIIM